MKRALSHAAHTLWVTCLVLIVLLAVVFSIARALTPLVTSHREAVANWVTTAVGQPVQIGALAVVWHGLQPRLEGKNVVIIDPEEKQPLLAADALEVRLNLLSSILTGSIHIAEVKIIGAQLILRQNADNSVTLISNNNTPTNPSPMDDKTFNKVMLWLFKEPNITLEDISLTWQGKDGINIPIHEIDVTLKSNGGSHILLGRAQIAQETASQLTFVADIKGNWQNKQKITARLYVDAEDIILQQWLNRVYPALKQGQIDLQLWGSWQNTHLQSVQSLFALHDLKIRGKKFFAITDLSGNLFLQPDSNGNWQFAADLASQNSKVDFGPLFRKPIPLQQFTAYVGGQQDATGWLVQAAQVTIRNADAIANANMGLFIPQNGDSPTIGLLAATRFNNTLQVANYLPLTVLKPALVTWLGKSIKRFDGINSTLVINGQLADFPYDGGKGTFIVDSRLNNLDVDYFKGWPSVDQIMGQLVFYDRSMDLMIDSAKTLDIPVQNIHVFIPIIKKEVQSILNVDADNIQSTLGQGFAFLRSSPLRQGGLAAVANFDGQGPVQTQLHLAIPLEDGKIKTQVQGKINLPGNILDISKTLQIQKLVGQLTFTQDNLAGKGLVGILWKKPISFTVATQPSKQIKIKYGDVNATLVPQNNSWALNLTAPGVVGQVSIPSNKQQPMQANFKQIYLSDSTTSNIQKFSAQDVPLVNLNADDVRYGVKQFGQVKLQLVPIASGVSIKNLTATTPAYTLTANGAWNTTKKGNDTQLAGNLVSADISTALANWGMPAAIKAQQSQIQFTLNWPDSAYNPTLAKTSGKITLSFSKGKIVGLSSSTAAKIGIGNLLTSMSLQSFSRYLRFDFSNLTSQDFDFDTLKGTFTLDNGNAYTQDLEINGPLAHVTIKGRVGLAAQNYDLQVKVKPNVTSGIPVIIAIVNPIAGAVAWAANKILSPAVSTITADTYRMTGSWSKPVVVKGSDK